MKILIGVDGSKYGDAAVAEVANRPWPTGSEVRLVFVLEVLAPEERVDPADHPNKAEVEQLERQRGKFAIDAATAALERGGFDPAHISSTVLPGKPKQQLIDESERWNADLIVLGAYGHRGLMRFLIGSVSQAVAQHAHCSVEIVRMTG